MDRLACPAPRAPIRLVAFDLDGTLLRGDTVCEAIAAHLGRMERMRELERAAGLDEVRAAREEMARWYAGVSRRDLLAGLASLQLAPGTHEALRLLRANRVRTAIVSVTWEFAVREVARGLGADFWAGTGLRRDGRIDHFWPEDKATWLSALARRLGITLDQTAAVGDSSGDIPMLSVAGHGFYVGERVPKGLEGVRHYPCGDMLAIARDTLGLSAPALG